MDYKELIELSKKAAAEWQGTHEYYQAAVLITSLCDAIETLLAEREAAVAEIPKECSKCAHFGKTAEEQPCHDCWYVDGPMKHWQWRGPTPPDRERTEG